MLARHQLIKPGPLGRRYMLRSIRDLCNFCGLKDAALSRG
jgi:hypothetical protein